MGQERHMFGDKSKLETVWFAVITPKHLRRLRTSSESETRLQPSGICLDMVEESLGLANKKVAASPGAPFTPEFSDEYAT